MPAHIDFSLLEPLLTAYKSTLNKVQPEANPKEFKKIKKHLFHLLYHTHKGDPVHTPHIFLYRSYIGHVANHRACCDILTMYF